MDDRTDTDRARITRVVDAAARAFGRAPTFVARAPGRVNLIGEHTDYNGLPVMPMAIDRNVLIAGAARDDGRVHLRNSGPFGERTYDLGENIAPFTGGDWGNYSKAAAQGLRRHIGASFVRGADLLVDGNVPDGAGLSSSAALVVANALALLAANEIEVPPAELADVLPRAEQYVGTLSGGMDQTVSLLGRRGHALRIDFRPLRYRPVPLPPGHVFVVAHSLVHADKAGAAKRAYNLRVAECRIAAWAAARILGGAPGEVMVLGDVLRVFAMPADAIVAALAQRIPAGAHGIADIAAHLGVTLATLRASVALPDDVGEHFVLVERARHVLREAERVDAAEAALGAGDVATFARKMAESHESCRDDYAISCPALEALVQIATGSGALAARLTGAGFGGCIVALVARENVDHVLSGIDAAFYAPRGVNPAARAGFRFVIEPTDGAEILLL